MSCGAASGDRGNCTALAGLLGPWAANLGRRRALRRLVPAHCGEYPSLWAAIESIAPKIGCVPQTLLEWAKPAEVDAGGRPGVSTAEAKHNKDLERGAQALRRANEILKRASAFSPRWISTAG